MAYTVPNPNVLLASTEDKLGHQLVELKTQLVATGLWRVRGSGDGFTVQLMGQTAGVGGSYDVFSAATKWLAYTTYGLPTPWYGGAAGSMSRNSAWFLLEEIGSGRCLLFQRSSGVDAAGAFTVKLAPGGFASTGATSTVAPAAVGASNTWNVAGMTAYTPTTPPENGPALWLQVGRSDVADPGGVCPFWACVYNRTAGTPVWGMLYESLEQTPAGDVHPFIFGTGVWSAGGGFFGTPFNGSNVWGGAAMTSRRLTALSVNGAPYPNATPSIAQPIGPDGKWRAIHPPVNDGSAWCGRCKNVLSHPINRDYPTTYGIATGTPRLALGQILVPWTTVAAPQSSP